MMQHERWVILEPAAKYIPDILNFLKDEKVNSSVRSVAAQALGNFGEPAAKYIPDIVTILKDEKVDSDVRSSAARALSNFEEAAAKYIPDILNIFKDEKVDSDVRYGAARALSNFEEAAAKYIPDIVNILKNILKDEKVDSRVRYGAASALGNFGEAAAKYIPDIVNILKDEKVNSSVRYGAARALSNFGEPAAKYIPDILNILKDEKADSEVRRGAAYALGNFEEAAAKYIPDILNILKDEKVDSEVRKSAVYALVKFGEPAAAKYIPDILNILKDEKVDSEVRRNAAWALAKFGQPAAKYIPDILNILKNEKVDSEVRRNAAQALGNFGQQLELEQIVVILNNLYEPSHSEFKRWRFLTYFTGGGTEDVKILLTWLGYPLPQTNLQQLNYDEAKKTLEVFLKVWQPTKDLRRVRNDLARKIGTVAKDKNFTWKLQDISLLQNHYDNLKASGYNDADTLRYVINNLEFWKWFVLARKIILVHFAIWLTIILLYPEFTQILAPLFWNPWLRKILGFGYIGILLTCVPWLRRRLLQPFQPLLLADAGLDNFIEQAYFGESSVKVPRRRLGHKGTKAQRRIKQEILNRHCLDAVAASHREHNVMERGNPSISRLLPFGNTFGKRYTIVPLAIINRFLFLRRRSPIVGIVSLPLAMINRFWRKRVQQETNVLDNITPRIQPITKAIPTLQGQIVLEGESGLGKSMFLRHLVNNSQRIFVYIPAQKCDKGVIKAISTKLQAQVDDAEFLKNLIYNGALDIYIDGLNEVTADTRAKISQFAESHFKGNIIMTTQPLDWIPPSTARKYELQPLEREQIQQFLLSRFRVLCKGNLVAKPVATEYETACNKYLAEAFNEQQSPEDLAATKRILSNPMDLTLVALMLSQGQQPNLFRLQEQQYQLMAAEYQREWQQEFPLTTFCEAVYQMRLHDETIIPNQEFKPALTCLEDEKYKMVISRQWENDKGEPQKSWHFRHDKVMEFFLVHNFHSEGQQVQERINQHINDPRFRGVYLLLANLLSLNAAVELREKIIDYAANSKDHTLSDKFVQLLQLRLPQKWTRGVKSVLQQHEQKTWYLNLVAKFLEQVDATIKRDKKLYLTIETIPSSLSNYAPFPVLITVGTPTDEDIINLVKLSQQLPTESTQKAGLLIYKIPPDTTVRMEIAKVRLRDNFLLIPLPVTSVEKALADKYECKYKCTGLLEEYIDRYLDHADFFDDRNAISDTLSFFGRTEILQRLGEELLRYQGIGLFGLRKSGKTSVLLQLGFMLREHPIVHIDLQTYSGYRYGAALFNKIIQHLSTLESEIPLPQFVPFSLDKPAAELTDEFIQRVNKLARAIQKSHKYKLPILCFLDEVERIIPTPEDNREKAEEFNAFFGALRVLSQQQKEISLLVADVHPDCNRINSWTQTGVATNPVFSFFKEIFLPPFSEEETQDMLVNLGKLMGLEFDAATPKKIHAQSGGHPFVSRQLARFLTDKIKDKDNHPKLAKNGNTLIEWAMVEKYLAKILTQKGELKNYLEKSIWEDLEKRNFQVAISVLRIIACNETFHHRITQPALINQLKSRFTANQCLDACNWLINVGLLYQEEVEHEDLYYIRVPLLTRWIQMQMTDEEIEQCRIL